MRLLKATLVASAAGTAYAQSIPASLGMSLPVGVPTSTG